MLVVRVETDLEKIPKSLWIKDSKSNACNVCKRSISGSWIKSNKHHCRFCGHIVCSSCSNHAVFFTSKSNLHRICDTCYQSTIVIEEEEKVSTITTKEGEQETTSTSNLATSANNTSSSNPNSSSSSKPRRNQLLDILSSTVSSPKSFEVAPKSASTNIPKAKKKQTFENKFKSKLIIDYQTTPKLKPQRNVSRARYWINRRDVVVKGYLNRLKKKQIIPSLPKDIINMITSWSSINDTWKLYGDTIIKHIKTTISSQSIERISESHEHCYYSFGSARITNGNIKEWKIRIDRVEYYTNNYCSMLIGIVETRKISWIKSLSLLGDCTYGAVKGYCLRVAIKSRFVHDQSQKPIFIENGNLRKGDIVKIRLDLSSSSSSSSKYGSLSYSFEDGGGQNINYGLDNDYKWLGLPKNIAFDKINKTKSYSLVVGMYCRNKLTFLEEVDHDF